VFWSQTNKNQRTKMTLGANADTSIIDLLSSSSSSSCCSSSDEEDHSSGGQAQCATVTAKVCNRETIRTATAAVAATTAVSSEHTASLQSLDDDSDSDSDIPTESVFVSSSNNSKSNVHKTGYNNDGIHSHNSNETFRSQVAASVVVRAGDEALRDANYQVQSELQRPNCNRKRNRATTEERDRLREAIKLKVKNDKLAAQQRSGKFAREEVGLLVHPHIKQVWTTQQSPHDQNQAQLQPWEELSLSNPHILECEGIDKGAIHFLRRDYLAGGAKSAIQAFQNNDATGYQLINRLLIIFYDPDDFLKLLHRSDPHEDDYPLLDEWLEQIYSSWKIKWSTTTIPKVMILLPRILSEIHRRWNGAPQNKPQHLAITDSDLNDAIVWLHVSARVECQIMKTDDDTLQFLRNMTRAISEEPYVQPVSELQCVKKIKSAIIPLSTIDAAMATNPVLERAHDTWIRMLQQVPGISSTRAEQLAQYFPTARSLWQFYQQPASDNTSTAHSVAHLFGERGQLNKLSEQLYLTMTSDNPKELLW
jgi:hypothetical protein